MVWCGRTPRLLVPKGLWNELDDLGQRAPEPVAPQRAISIRYWIMIARSTAEPGDPVRVASEILREAKALQPVLKELTGAMGPMEFSLLEQLRLSSIDGNIPAKIRGRKFNIEQRVLNENGIAFADLRLGSHGTHGILHSLDTRVRLESGKFVVLGQSAYNSRDGGLPQGWSPSDEPLLFFVISIDAA